MHRSVSLIEPRLIQIPKRKILRKSAGQPGQSVHGFTQFLILRTTDMWDWLILCPTGPPCALSGIEQRPRSPPTRCQYHLPP